MGIVNPSKYKYKTLSTNHMSPSLLSPTLPVPLPQMEEQTLATTILSLPCETSPLLLLLKFMIFL